MESERTRLRGALSDMLAWVDSHLDTAPAQGSNQQDDQSDVSSRNDVSPQNDVGSQHTVNGPNTQGANDFESAQAGAQSSGFH